MADKERTPKSGNEWTSEDLQAYNITIREDDFGTFFGQPVPVLSPSELLQKENASDMDTLENNRVMTYMYLAMDRVPNEESAVIPFLEKLFLALEYETLAKSVILSQQMPFFACRASRNSTADLCITDMSEVLLIAQEDKRHIPDAHDPEPQLIAQAIATFQFNNFKRTRVLDEPPLSSKVIAGITMLGTSPTFFKIPITQALVSAVELGDYPTEPTVVSMHTPEIPRPSCRAAEGMVPLDNREIIFACFEAFKQFV